MSCVAFHYEPSFVAAEDRAVRFAEPLTARAVSGIDRQVFKLGSGDGLDAARGAGELVGASLPLMLMPIAARCHGSEVYVTPTIRLTIVVDTAINAWLLDVEQSDPIGLGAEIGYRDAILIAFLMAVEIGLAVAKPGARTDRSSYLSGAHGRPDGRGSFHS